MKSKNLLKCCDSFDFFFAELRKAHTDAVNSENEFAEIVIFSLIEEAAKMQPRLARVKDATIQSNAGAAKKGKVK